MRVAHLGESVEDAPSRSGIKEPHGRFAYLAHSMLSSAQPVLAQNQHTFALSQARAAKAIIWMTFHQWGGRIALQIGILWAGQKSSVTHRSDELVMELGAGKQADDVQASCRHCQAHHVCKATANIAGKVLRVKGRPCAKQNTFDWHAKHMSGSVCSQGHIQHSPGDTAD